MYQLGKWLFPKNPRMVRYRKLRILFFAIAFSVLACVCVGLIMFLLNHPVRQ